MRKSFVILSVAILLALVLWAPITASPPEPASGKLTYTPFPVGEPKMAGGNVFLNTIEVASWEGMFVGDSLNEGEVVIHRSGLVSYKATGNFSGSVDGLEGELTFRLLGTKSSLTSPWTGQWIILGGTGELTNLRGQGTLFGPGSPGFGQEGFLLYEGDVHFDPSG